MTNFDNRRGEKTFDGVKTGKLGTELNPARITVKSEERRNEIEALFREHGWHFELDLKPDGPEDVADLDFLLQPKIQAVAEEKIGRNDPCPCGSGKKYKKCCEEGAL